MAKVAIPLALAALTVLGVLGVVPTAAALPMSERSAVLGTSVAGFVGDATWNGRDVSTAATPAHAIGITFDQSDLLHLSWYTQGAPSGVPFAITDAILRIQYFGQIVWTRDQVFNPAASAGVGDANLTTDLSQNHYLIEGLYLLEVELVSDTRGTVWSASFYVHATAAYQATAATVALAGLLLYELVALARVGPYGLPGGPPPRAPEGGDDDEATASSEDES